MGYDLRIERLINATPGKVFDAFTRPEAHKNWFRADQPNWKVTSKVDLRVGGSWDLSFGTEKDGPYRARVVFTEMERPHRLAFTMTRIWPDTESFDTDFVVTFQA